MGGPLYQGAQKDDRPAILLVNCQSPRSASVAERLRLLTGFLTKQCRLQRIDTLLDAASVRRRHGVAIASQLKSFVRKAPSCEIVHCNLAEPEAWTVAALGQVLLARFFGKAVVADLGSSINEESFEHPPLVLRMILVLCTMAVVTSEHAAAIVARRGVNVEQIPEALAASEFVDRKVQSVQPQILAVYPHGDRVAGECLAKAFKLVKTKYPRTEMTILADERDRNICRQLISERDRSSITVASAGNFREAVSCYAEADMLINSSVARGLRPMLKGMASGLPVVAATGYFRDELIVDRKNGLAYRENDPGDLADRIIELIETPELISQLTGQARLTVAVHAWSIVSRRWLACYRKLQQSPRAAEVARAGHHSHLPT